MRRFVPTILAILAVIGFWLPPAQIVHAHDDGHDPHAHGAAHTAHAPLHGHSHTNAPTAPDDDEGDDGDDHPHDGDAPDHHVHHAQAPTALARLRGPNSALDGLVGSPVVLAPVAGLWSLTQRALPQPDDAVPRRGRVGPRDFARSLDRLIWIGSLLI